jgi:hypothetical protein
MAKGIKPITLADSVPVDWTGAPLKWALQKGYNAEYYIQIDFLAAVTAGTASSAGGSITWNIHESVDGVNWSLLGIALTYTVGSGIVSGTKYSTAVGSTMRQSSLGTGFTYATAAPWIRVSHATVYTGGSPSTVAGNVTVKAFLRR